MEDGIRDEDVITIISEDGEELRFWIVDKIQYEEINYILGYFMESSDTDIHILEVDEFEEDIDLIEVEDEVLKEAILAAIE